MDLQRFYFLTKILFRTAVRIRGNDVFVISNCRACLLHKTDNYHSPRLQTAVLMDYERVIINMKNDKVWL
jgi:hypothetical protein